MILRTNRVNDTYHYCLMSLLAILWLPAISDAATVELKLANGLTATANYQKNNLKTTGIIILHGFLVTRHFRTIANLSTALFDEEYTVLAPNLTLGIHRRKVSLACEAIHTHNMSDDINEIHHWVNWLIKQGHKEIVIIGHSFGSLHSLAYLSHYAHPAVKKLIITSLIDLKHAISKKTSTSQIKTAQAQLAKNNHQLQEYQVSYCKKYVTSPSAFLSYALWSKEHIIKVLSTIKIPTTIIVGSADQRMDSHWIDKLNKSGKQLIRIDGANHFFDAEHEFDLLENILGSLE